MHYQKLTVAADVGGTFTDCIVQWADSAESALPGPDDSVGKGSLGPEHRCIKVLSSGILRCRVIEVFGSRFVRHRILGRLSAT